MTEYSKVTIPETTDYKCIVIKWKHIVSCSLMSVTVNCSPLVKYP